MQRPAIGKVGVWSMELRFGDPGEGNAAAAELEALGYGAIWIPGGIDAGVTGDVARLLDATQRIAVCTGIINLWKHDPADLAAWWHGLGAARQARVLMGIGISHGPIIGEQWGKPLATMRSFMERLAAAGVPREADCLAALGPKMLALAGEVAGGAHPYLVNPEHTAEARALLGPEPLLAPEQGVVLESDPARARELAAGALAHYRRLPNYVNSWKRMGYSADEIESLAPRFIDGIFAWGTAEQIADRVRAHQQAGADHVCIQVVTGQMSVAAALPVWRELATVLI